MQCTGPANGTNAQQFVNAVSGSSGGHYLGNHAARRQFLLKSRGGPHAPVCAGSDARGRRRIHTWPGGGGGSAAGDAAAGTAAWQRSPPGGAEGSGGAVR